MVSRLYTKREGEPVRGAIHSAPNKMEWMFSLFNTNKNERRIRLDVETEMLGASRMNLHLSGIERDETAEGKERDFWIFRGTWFLTPDNWVHVIGRHSMSLGIGNFEEDTVGPNPSFLSTFGLGRAPEYDFIAGPGKFDIMAALFDRSPGRPNTVLYRDKSGKTVGPLHVYGVYPLHEDEKVDVMHCRTYTEDGMRLETSFCTKRRQGAGWATGVAEMNLANCK